MSTKEMLILGFLSGAIGFALTRPEVAGLFGPFALFAVIVGIFLSGAALGVALAALLGAGHG